MSGLLGSIFSFGDNLKKSARGLLADPIGYATNQVRGFNEQAEKAGAGLLAKGLTYQERAKAANDYVNALGAGPHALGGLLGGIKVFHGSPHVFDKADSSKIGTGEGAQAYGHGLYWAENPGVADSYRKALSDNTFSVGGADLPGPVAKYGQTGQSPARQALPMPQKMATYALDSAMRAGSDDPAKAAIAHLTKHGKGNADAKEAAAIIQQWAQQGSKVEAGNLYEANLRWPDAAREAKDPLGPQHFLDWDKPLAEQGEAVRSGVRSALVGRGIAGSVADHIITNRSGSDAISTLGRGQYSPHLMPPDGAPAATASAALRQAGIPGIGYLDGGSRGAAGNGRWTVTYKDGKSQVYDFKPNDSVLQSMGATATPHGTRNYVTFDDALVELLSRNGQPLLGKISDGNPPVGGLLGGAARMPSSSVPKNVAEWLGDSKIVADNGEPLVLYHGTKANFDKFDIEKDARDVGGVWFTNSHNYAYDMAGGRNGTVKQAYLKASNPLKVDVLEEGRRLADEIGVPPPKDSMEAQEMLAGGIGWDKVVSDMVSDAKKAGHDALILSNFNDGRVVDSTAYVVFRADQIMEAAEKGGSTPGKPLLGR